MAARRGADSATVYEWYARAFNKLWNERLFDEVLGALPYSRQLGRWGSCYQDIFGCSYYRTLATRSWRAYHPNATRLRPRRRTAANRRETSGPVALVAV